MPVVLLERLPLPSLRTYTSISIALLGCAVYYAVQIVHERHADLEEARKNASGTAEEVEVKIKNGTNYSVSALNSGQSYLDQTVDVLFEETWCVWVRIHLKSLPKS